MSISCPNKRLLSWKNLVKNVGENKAYVLWAEYGGNVPENYYESKEVALEEVKSKEVDFSDVISENVEPIFINSEQDIDPESLKKDNNNQDTLFGNKNVTVLLADEVLTNLIQSDVFEKSKHTSFFLEKAMNLLKKSGSKLKLVTQESNKEIFDSFDSNSVMKYDSISNTIYVTDSSLNTFNSETIASAFIHEVVHSTTVKAYFAAKTFEEKDFKEFIQKAYNQYKFLATKRDSKGNLSYGFTNEIEFIAEIFSNPEFVKEIESIEKSWLANFIDYIRRIFDMSKNVLNDELIKSAVLFSRVNEAATKDASRWKGTLVYDPRYDIYKDDLFKKVERPENSILEDKINMLLDNQLNNIDSIIKRASSSNRSGTKNEKFINEIKKLNTVINETLKTDKLQAINQYTDFMISQIQHVYNLIKSSSNTSDLEKLGVIERYKSYLGASDLLKPIMDTLNDTRVKGLTEDEKNIINEIQDKLTAISGAHDQVKSNFRTHTTQALRKELKSSYYSEKAVQEFREEIGKQYPANSSLSKKEWINEQIVLRQDELDERIEKDINNVLDGLSTDIDGFDTKLLTVVNTKSRLIQIVMKVISKMKSKIDLMVRDNDFKLDKLYQDLMAEKGKYDITNLYDTSKDGEVYLKGEYSVEFREKYINEYSKLLDEVNVLKEKHRKAGFQDIEINQFADVNDIYRKLAAWRKENIVKIGNREMPHSKYKNKLNFSKAEQAIYNEFLNLARQSEHIFGVGNSLIKTSSGAVYYTLPYATVSTLERVTSGRLNIKDTVKQKISNFTDWKIDEIDHVENMYRQDGTRIHNIPVMYRNNVSKIKDANKYKELIKEQSFDLLTLMRLEHYNQTNFDIKSQNEVILNAFIDISRDKKYLKTQPGTNNLVSNLFGIKTKYVTFEGVESNEYKRLQTVINQSLYNIFHEESFKIAGKDVNKLVQSVNRYTSFLGMTVNYFNAPVNVINAEFQTFLLKIGKDIDSGKLIEAHQVYANDLPNILADTGRPTKYSKVNQLNLLTDVFGGLTHEQNDFIKNTLLKGIADPNVLQVMQNGGEHMVQSVLNIALLKSIKVMNDKGQYVDKEGKVAFGKDIASIFDMTEEHPDTRQIQFNDKFTYTDKSSATEWNKGGLENVRLFIKKKLFDTMGEYDKNFRTEIQQQWWGQLLMMYKKFIIPLGIARYRGINKGFAKKEDISDEDRHWNESLQKYEEGFYTTTFRFITRGFAENLVKLKFDLISKNWNELTDYEKSNIKKGIVEMGSLMLLQTIIVPLLVGLARGAGDDDNELMYLAMMARKVEQELSFYTDPNDAYKVTKNPVASMNLIEDLLNVAKFTISPSLWFSETREGGSRAYKVLEQIAIPTAVRPERNSKTILQGMNQGLLAPYENGVFYQLMNSK